MASARASTPLPPASLRLRLSSILERIAEVFEVIPQPVPTGLAEFVGV